MQNLFGLIRHALTFGGGFVVANGYLDEASLSELVGLIMGIVGIVWSIINKNPQIVKKSAVPAILLPLLVLFTILPSGCITGPDGKTTIDPAAKGLIAQVARAAALVGLSTAASEIPILTPFVPSMAQGVNNIFATQDDPKIIGQELQKLASATAIEIGQAELDKLILKYVSDELNAQIPAGGPAQQAQFLYNKDIRAGFNL